MKPYSILLPVVLVLSVGLMTGCKRPEGASRPASHSQQGDGKLMPVQEKKILTQEQLAEKKLNAYSEAYDTLVDGEHGLPEAYKAFMKNVVKGKASDNIAYPVVDGLEKSLEILRQTRAEKTEGQEELDAAADKLIVSGEKVLARERELVPYFKGKAYKKDNMGRFKSVASSVQDDYESALSALSQLGEQIMKQKRAASEKRMEQLKVSGDMIRYHTEEIITLTDELLALFDDPKVPFNRNTTFSNGNSIVVKLDTAIRAQRKAVDEARVKNVTVSAAYDTIRNGAAGIISDYRDVRDKRSQTAFDAMLKRYDRAVYDFNNAQIKN